MTTTTTVPNRKPPLAGIKVVEFAIFISGPAAASILGEMGADVVRVEGLSGDPARKEILNFGNKPLALKNGESLFHAVANRNKKDIAVDVTTPAGREILHRLIVDADVFVTNLRAETKEKLGIDYTAVSKINPRIVYASVSGFGADGPMSSTGAFDPLGQAASGMVFLGTKEPHILPGAVLDQASAIVLSHSILAALLARERQGVGQETRVSLYGTGLWLMYFNVAAATLLSASTRDMDLGAHWKRPLRKAYLCQDGKWILGVHHPDAPYWRAFCEATGQTALLQDPRFAGEAGRLQYAEELLDTFDAVFLTKTRAEWLSLLLPKGLFFAPIHETTDVQDDPQALANGYVVDFDDPALGWVKIPGFPISFSGSEVGTTSLAPRLGEHTDCVLREIGYSDEDIQRLRKLSVVK